MVNGKAGPKTEARLNSPVSQGFCKWWLFALGKSNKSNWWMGLWYGRWCVIQVGRWCVFWWIELSWDKVYEHVWKTETWNQDSHSQHSAKILKQKSDSDCLWLWWFGLWEQDTIIYNTPGLMFCIVRSGETRWSCRRRRMEYDPVKLISGWDVPAQNSSPQKARTEHV